MDLHRDMQFRDFQIKPKTCFYFFHQGVRSETLIVPYGRRDNQNQNRELVVGYRKRVEPSRPAHRGVYVRTLLRSEPDSRTRYRSMIGKLETPQVAVTSKKLVVRTGQSADSRTIRSDEIDNQVMTPEHQRSSDIQDDMAIPCGSSVQQSAEPDLPPSGSNLFSVESNPTSSRVREYKGFGSFMSDNVEDLVRVPTTDYKAPDQPAHVILHVQSSTRKLGPLKDMPFGRQSRKLFMLDFERWTFINHGMCLHLSYPT